MRTRICQIIATGLVGLGVSGASAQESKPADWIIPKICVDGLNHPVAADPYPGCPSGTRLRALAPGDPLPYRKLDQTSQQYKDIYPMTAANGTQVIVATFDWLDPKNSNGSRFKIWADGYDAIVIRDGWASVSETRNGSGEFGTTFMGKGCTNYNGLVFFPNALPDGSTTWGQAMLASAGVPWEGSNQPWPGSCPDHYVKDQITTWTYVTGLDFGGVAGLPTKSLDAIVTTVGLRTSKDPAVMKRWMEYAHLESFYFTKLYGLTRWEAWRPKYQFENDGREKAVQTQQRAAGVSARCHSIGVQTATPFILGAATDASTRISMTYGGKDFVMTDCRDWSNIVIEKTPVPPPAWPVSALNLLSNFHFNGQSIDKIKDWSTTGLTHASARISKTTEDTTKNTPEPQSGVAYLRVDCTTGCGSDRLYQDVPISHTTHSGAYTIGVIARTEVGTGTLEIALSQLDRKGKMLSTETFYADNIVPEQTGCDEKANRCRKFLYKPTEDLGSVILSSNFASWTFPLSLNPQAKILRFTISPKTANVFNIVSAWLMFKP